MVIEDFPRSSTGAGARGRPPFTGGTGRSVALVSASPVDRLAAFVADFVLLIPLMSLLTAPFRRQHDVAVLLGNEGARLAALFALVMGAMFSTILYQTVAIGFWGTTPGKRLLGLRVVEVWSGRRPTVVQAFLRSCVWCLEFFLLLVPWLAVYTDERRRSWHDRIADTEVRAIAEAKAVGAPTAIEAALASSLRAAMVFALFGFVSATMVVSKKKSGVQERSAYALNPYFCKQVTEAGDEWIGAESAPPSRVDVALAMFGADAIDERCLEVEAEYALWNGMESAAAYMAKALARADDAETYVRYARKACDKGARDSACLLGRLLAGEQNEPRAPAAAGSIGPIDLDEFVSGLSASSPFYLRVFAVRELVDTSRYAEALRIIEHGSPHRRLGYFFASHRAQALWGLHRKDEARLAVQSSIEGLASVQRTALARWLCSAENAVTCGDEAVQSCGLLSRAVERDPTELEDAQTAVAWIRGEECSTGGRLDLVKMKDLLRGREGRLLVSGLESVQSGDAREARLRFESLVTDSDIDSAFWFEAQARLVAVAESETELAKIQDRWSTSESADAGWLRLGHALLRRSESLGLGQRTLSIASRVLEWDPFDLDLRRRLVVLAYKAGDVGQAAQALEQLPAPSSSATRRIASVSSISEDEFERIARAVSESRVARSPSSDSKARGNSRPEIEP